MSSDIMSFPAFPFARPAGDTPSCEYARLRDEAPVSRVTLWDGSNPWLITRHEMVQKVLAVGDGSGRWSKDRRQPGFPEFGAAAKASAMTKPTFVYLDEPERTRDRQIIDRIFAKENIDKIRPRLVEHIVESLLCDLQEQINEKPVDFYRIFAMRVPTFVIFSLLGAPSADLDDLTEWNLTQLNGSSTPTEVSSANKKLLGYVSQLLEQKIESPGNDLVSELVISEGLIILEQHPDQKADLIQDPCLASAFVEELCRFHTSSATANPRVAVENLYLDGQMIRAGEAILLSLQSANRDETVFPEPDIFNMHRKRGSQESLAFGFGPRRCPVEWLAREQLETVFSVSAVLVWISMNMN
ncbi:hypothetical protein DV738_g1481, partial [Chaetothyriales sp. CBS 135597]